jgi:hypothetical protein
MTYKLDFPPLNGPYSGSPNKTSISHQTRLAPDRLVDYFRFVMQGHQPRDANRADVLAYVRDLKTQPKSVAHASLQAPSTRETPRMERIC